VGSEARGSCGDREPGNRGVVVVGWDRGILTIEFDRSVLGALGGLGLDGDLGVGVASLVLGQLLLDGVLARLLVGVGLLLGVILDLLLGLLGLLGGLVGGQLLPVRPQSLLWGFMSAIRALVWRS